MRGSVVDRGEELGDDGRLGLRVVVPVARHPGGVLLDPQVRLPGGVVGTEEVAEGHAPVPGASTVLDDVDHVAAFAPAWPGEPAVVVPLALEVEAVALQHPCGAHDGVRLDSHEQVDDVLGREAGDGGGDRKSTRLNSSHVAISYAVFCLKTKKHTYKLRSSA